MKQEIYSFGYWLRLRRKSLDLTQAELARRASCSPATIRKIEADERRPSRELAELLADQLLIPDSERKLFVYAARGLTSVNQLSSVGPAELSAPLPFAPSPPSNLPAPLTSLINRANDITAVTRLLLRDDVRLVTLIGPPGIGKTRLSIQAAEKVLPHFADGACFVDLSPISEAGLVLPTIAAELAITRAPIMPLQEQIRESLRDSQLLLVLDNFEHVVEGLQRM